MKTGYAIIAENISKKFSNTLRTSMLYGVKDSVRRLCGRRVSSEELRTGEFWALNRVSFEIRRGEGFAIMGANGSGKTTLLRILAGIFRPDAGQVSLKGRIGALIALGAGFAPTLSGRENIYVNGALLGMRKAEINAKVDEILDFSGVGTFADLPVKHYSSGMVVRLGFAVAAMSKPDILLVDEIFAVGDLNFQKKCYEYLQHLKGQGTSIVLVTHAISTAWAICQRGIVLHQGSVQKAGSVDDILRVYQDLNAAHNRLDVSVPPGEAREADDEGTAMPSTYGGPKGGTGEILVSSVSVRGMWSATPTNQLHFNEPFAIAASIKVNVRMPDLIFRFSIDAAHYKYITCLDSIEQDCHFDEVQPGFYRIKVDVPAQELMPGAYRLNVAVCQKGLGGHLYFEHGVCEFLVLQPNDRLFYAEDTAVYHLAGIFSLSDAQGQSVTTRHANDLARVKQEEVSGT